MCILSKLVLGLWAIGLGLGVSAPAQADAVGPYYAMPSWDQTLPPATRFVVLSNLASAAVLDRETGLVWEKVPNTTHVGWYGAREHCLQAFTGGRMGWRLPAIPELASLVDRVPLPSLPAGHPFTVQSSGYWSATALAEEAGAAWFVDLNGGFVYPEGKFSSGRLAWCVRGGPGGDTQ